MMTITMCGNGGRLGSVNVWFATRPGVNERLCSASELAVGSSPAPWWRLVTALELGGGALSLALGGRAASSRASLGRDPGSRTREARAKAPAAINSAAPNRRPRRSGGRCRRRSGEVSILWYSLNIEEAH